MTRSAHTKASIDPELRAQMRRGERSIAALREDFVTVGEAAEELGLRPGTLRSRIFRGTVSAIKVGGIDEARFNLIPRADVERMREQIAARHARKSA